MNDTTATPALRPDQRAQLDRARRPCPPWCITDHSLKFSSVHVGHAHGAGRAWACAVLRGWDESPVVGINGVADGASASLTLSVQDAEQLAALAAMAGAEDLAAAIRQAAADITDLLRLVEDLAGQWAPGTAPRHRPGVAGRSARTATARPAGVPATRRPCSPRPGSTEWACRRRRS